jgi:WhiB family redox-sensing transcriptional regulator
MGELTWMNRAACKHLDLALFFGYDGEPFAERAEREVAAIQVCAGCPVRVPCLEAQLARTAQFGVAGGMTADERTAERKRRMRRAS